VCWPAYVLRASSDPGTILNSMVLRGKESRAGQARRQGAFRVGAKGRSTSEGRSFSGLHQAFLARQLASRHFPRQRRRPALYRPASADAAQQKRRAPASSHTQPGTRS